MGRHAAPDEEPEVVEVQPEPPAKKKFDLERLLPHIAVAAVTIFYVLFYLASGAASGNWTGAAVPQTVNLAWGGALTTWLGYCIRERATSKGDK